MSGLAPAAGPRRRAVLAAIAGLGISPPSQAATEPVTKARLAGHRLSVHIPPRMLPRAPLILLLHGLGPPRSPDELAAVLPPVSGAVSLYAPLPFTPDAPGGFADALRRRQESDFAGDLMVPLLRAAQVGMEAIVEDATARYGLAADRPLHLFGFSMGGAAVLAALSRSPLRPQSVIAVNAPLSVRSAVAAYERKLRTRYVPRDPTILDAYDVAAESAQIRRRHPHLRLRLVQSAGDDQFSVAAARATAAALNRGPGAGPAALTVLPGGGHNDLAASPDIQARLRGILQRQVAGR